MHRRGKLLLPHPQRKLYHLSKKDWVSTYFFLGNITSLIYCSGRASVRAWSGEAGECATVPEMRARSDTELGLAFSTQLSYLPAFTCFSSLLRCRGLPDHFLPWRGKGYCRGILHRVDGSPKPPQGKLSTCSTEKPNLNTKMDGSKETCHGPARSVLMCVCSSSIKIKTPWEINSWAWNLAVISHLLMETFE